MLDEQLSLFADEDLADRTVTIHVSYNTTRTVLRSIYELPTGECPLENSWYVDHDEAKHYSVRLIEHGPFMSSTQACQWGACTQCRSGDHKSCPFLPGRTHDGGSVHPVGGDYLEHRDHRGHWRPLHDVDGRPVMLFPNHVWHCTCECHPIDMLAEIAEANR